jgi:RimJ/RimL family protein N-acetyltransferase
MEVIIRKAHPSELQTMHHLITFDPQWTKFNGPYFSYESPSIMEFQHNVFARLCAGQNMQLIVVNNKPIGSVSYYWECESTRWLEMGIIIYDSSFWRKGIGCKALPLWISHLFETLDIARVGLTTWSGNKAMMFCAKKTGFKQEACLRKVRFYQGKYYDSIKYGMLREEWKMINVGVRT